MDYTATIATTATAETAARKIIEDLEIWWSTRVDRRDGGFTLHFNDSHATFAVDPGGLPAAFGWTCTGARMIIEDVDDPAEWVGTRLSWRVEPAPGGSAVTLTHVGLTPRIACFDTCRRGWRHFFETSLRDHLNGRPASPERGRGAARGAD